MAVDQDVEAIDTIRVEATEAFKNGDFETFLTYFADDAVWMPADEPPVVGKDAFREWGVQFAEASRPVHFTTSEEIVVDGNLAFDRFTLTTAEESAGAGESQESVLQGLWILQRQANDSWKIARYIWNFN
jgi:ketosteroid isomerase-like protein